MKPPFLIRGIEFGKDGFIVRLASRDEMVNNACQFVSRILCRLEGAMSRGRGSGWGASARGAGTLRRSERAENGSQSPAAVSTL